jgi:uncharacterized membrane protein
MMIAAFRLTFRKYRWLPLIGIVQGVVIFIAKYGANDIAGMAEVALLSGLSAVLALALIMVPLEYHRLKRQAAGFPVTSR